MTIRLFLQVAKIFLLSFFFSFFIWINVAVSQVPAKVFEITNILVDGCAGSDEGRNEMVLFQIGPNPIHISDLRVDGAGSTGVITTNNWPNTNNSWRGIAPPPAMPIQVAQINATIIECGFLIEPTGGIIPAGKKVLLITSTEFTPTAHSFATLQDTMYIIFQNPGNTSGHFVNYGTPSSSRTLVLMHVPTSVADTVIYDRSLLVNQLGNPGAQDGAAVLYNWAGAATYYNNGCQALYIAYDPSWYAPSPVCSSDQPINLNDYLTGTGGGYWSGTNISGDFFDPSGLSGDYSITYTMGNAPCDTSETHTITVISSPSADWTVPDDLCSDENPVNLNDFITGTPGGLWTGTGVAGNFFDPSGLSGTYSVTYTVGSSPCIEQLTNSITVISNSLANWNVPQYICTGNLPINLSDSVSGTNGGMWNGTGITDIVNGIFDPQISGAGLFAITYYIEGICGDTVTHEILVNESPVVVVNLSDETCVDNADGWITLDIFGGLPPYTILWSNLSSNDSIHSLSPGNYSFEITDENFCIVTGSSVIMASTVECDSPHLYIPNVFSPNGDGQNDILFIRGEGIQTVEFIIFNRWGQKVFRSTNISVGWDGQYMGYNAEIGVYSWIVEASFIDGPVTKLSGTTTLIR
jgi:gliding motility-associated-like protein